MIVYLARVASRSCSMRTTLQKDPPLADQVGDQTRCDECHCLVESRNSAEMRKEHFCSLHRTCISRNGSLMIYHVYYFEMLLMCMKNQFLMSTCVFF